MERTIVALLVAAGMVVAGAGYVAMPGVDDAQPSASHDGHDHDHEHGHGEQGYYWLPERDPSGSVPTFEKAMTELEDVGYVEISGNAELAASGVIDGGSGTAEDPYVIQGVYARELDIHDTDAWFTVKNSYLHTLRINWNDQGAWVHHNHIGDLRVNENDPRTGNATGGIIEHNEIGRVGQIRHFDGTFRYNVVGQNEQPLENPFEQLQEAINVDGYINAEFYENTVQGEVVIDLHGHGHSSCRGCPTHNHWASLNESEKERAEEYQEDAEEYESLPNQTGHAHEHDHSRRFHTIAFHNNTVEDPDGRGIYIEDRNHAGDDRTANSEPDPEMMGDHWHDIQIVVADNVIRKAGIEVDIMVARDEYHVPGGQVQLVFERNTVQAGDGELIDLHKVRNATVTLTGNELVSTDEATLRDAWSEAPWSRQSGIRMDEVVNATVTVTDSTFEDLERGVAATEMPGSTTWSVTDNTFVSVSTPVWWDDTVANEPVVEDNTRKG